MTRHHVTVGTDGNKDWVQTPDGQKFSLGSVSVLSFVSQLALNRNEARRALDKFLKEGSASLKVDSDHMWGILAPRRTLWASNHDGPFIPHDHRQASRKSMETLDQILSKTEKIVAYCNKQASAGQPINPQAFKDLATSLEKLSSQSDNSAFYGLGLPKVDRPEDGFANEVHSEAGLVEKNAGLSFDTYDSNLKLASDILAEAKETVATINKLAAAGKKFKREAALKDVASVTQVVANICEKTALTEEWVASDLKKLAAENRRLHTLFHPKKS